MTSNKVSGFDIEDLCIDVFYWFDASTKCKGILKDFCTFCDSDYHEIVRYISVGWLSLEKEFYSCLNHLLVISNLKNNLKQDSRGCRQLFRTL